jgi:hypothetical protein
MTNFLTSWAIISLFTECMYRTNWHSSNAVYAWFESLPGYWLHSFSWISWVPPASMRPRPLLPKPFQSTILVCHPFIRSGIFQLLQRRADCWTAVSMGPVQPPIQWVPGLNYVRGWSCRGVRLTSHFHQIKNTWIYTSRSPYAFMTWCLVKKRDDFTECLSK